MAEILTLVFSIALFPITILASWLVVHPQEEAVVLRWGKFSGVVTQPGVRWANVWGRKIIKISTKHQAIDVHRTVVADGNGNPIVVAGVVTYRFVDTKKAALEVQDAPQFVKTQAMAVLKQVASRHPYESVGQVSLKSETGAVTKEMRDLLQEKVRAAGAEIATFELSDLSYAPEIAQAMLVRQQAQALVDARKVIVEGAVQIVCHAVELLEEKGLKLPAAEQPRLVSNLLTVICGEAHVQPTYSISPSGGGERSPDQEEKLTHLLEKIVKNTTPKS